jgi:CRISPR/Cas system-associated endonuclease Cas1
VPTSVTVAAIRERADRDVDVMFLESARFYRLPRSHPRFDALLATLEHARDSEQRVQLEVSEPNGDVIEDARPES